MPMIKVMIVDDHSLVRQGLCQLISLENDLVVAGEAQNGNDVLDKVADLKPDVVLMDLNLPGKNGIELTGELKIKFPDIHVLALTIDNDQNHVSKIIKAGALGYVLKDIDPDTLYEAIRTVAKGDAFIQPCLLTKLLHEFRQLMNEEKTNTLPEDFGLTQRELEIVSYIASGNSNKDIAEKLFISEKTVKNHVSSILKKMALEDRTQVAVYAYRKGLINE
ncbi:LuxR family two component transcriptional regulator [Hydrogenispora ethanolica]|jgi:DNA-binding NarL/FixJ family response regulator|uniref:LuxR family two component transcriptional regulator n=1 Tax=Hydrogenispora ethanolica TaxID=1082276 RepID=A0A4R1RB51_HYDET|nr:response regulator transcription factor [Hydrogenispora ethanolica]TCL63001.1 LuxR family two component transcriptional regulator [Hydrogenispora ethanolica]